jgi:hypothetical protein
VAAMAIVTFGGYVIAMRTNLGAQASPPVKINPDDIGGVVTSSNGPEAGVWVIAETTDLPTRESRSEAVRRTRFQN